MEKSKIEQNIYIFLDLVWKIGKQYLLRAAINIDAIFCAQSSSQPRFYCATSSELSTQEEGDGTACAVVNQWRPWLFQK
jgi:hypothetical protein